MYQDKNGDWHMEQGDSLDIKNVKVEGLDMENKFTNEFVKDGLAIFIKGQMVIGIHPDNLENNIIALNNGDMKIDWELLLSRANGLKK